jgi:hypothetical protein
MLIFLTVLYLYVRSGELEWLTLYSGQAHNSKYISELHAAQGTVYSPTTLI